MAAERARIAALTAVLAALGLVSAGCSDGGDSASARPAAASAAGEWRKLRNADLARTEVGAGRIGGGIYVVGGFLASGETTEAVERYSIRRDRWARLGPMPIAVNHPAVAAHGGRLYVYGGYTDSSFAPVTAALQRYDPRSGSWTLLAQSPTPRAAAALVARRGKLYAAGGASGGTALKTLEVYDIARGSWRAGAPMKVAREHIAGTLARGEVYVLGGRVGGENLDVVERYRPGRGWRRVASLETARSGFTAVTVGGRVIAFGGEELGSGGTTIRPVELYDPKRGHWRGLPGMRTPRHGLGGANLGRRVYALQGGPEPGLTVSPAIEFLDLPRRLLG